MELAKFGSSDPTNDFQLQPLPKLVASDNAELRTPPLVDKTRSLPSQPQAQHVSLLRRTGGRSVALRKCGFRDEKERDKKGDTAPLPPYLDNYISRHI